MVARLSGAQGTRQSAGYSPSIFDYTGKSRLTTYLKSQCCAVLDFLADMRTPAASSTIGAIWITHEQADIPDHKALRLRASQGFVLGRFCLLK